MKFNNEELRLKTTPEERREFIKSCHLAKHPEDTEVFIMPKVKNSMVGHLIRSGFKLCVSCDYLIDTENWFCSLCGRKYRTRIRRGKSNTIWDKDTEPIPEFFKKIKIISLMNGNKISLSDYVERPSK